jgi:hypothetical protein
MEMNMRRKAEKLALMRGGGGSLGKMAALKKGMVLDSRELRLVTLHLLSQHPSHGYEIIKSVEKLTSGVYAPSREKALPHNGGRRDFPERKSRATQ